MHLLGLNGAIGKRAKKDLAAKLKNYIISPKREQFLS